MAHSILIYGETDTYKTSQVGLFADYQFARTGKPVRLITCDSGFGPCQDQVDRGTIVPLALGSCPYAIAMLKKLERGLWPTVWVNAQAGIPYAEHDAVLRLDLNCGGFAIEGLTRICELARKQLCDRQQQTGEPLQGVHESMGEQIAFGSRGTVGAIHQLIHSFVSGMNNLNVDRVLWTSHEGKGIDMSGKKVFGPATMGTAITDKVPGWFAITLHHQSYQYADAKGAIHTGTLAYFGKHPDPELPKILWPAKLSVDPTTDVRIKRIFPGLNFPLIRDEDGVYVQGLDRFLELVDNKGEFRQEGQLEEVQQAVEERGEVKYEDAPVVHAEEDMPLTVAGENGDGGAAVVVEITAVGGAPAEVVAVGPTPAKEEVKKGRRK